jgi:uncharacterized protein (UPF0335 family)
MNPNTKKELIAYVERIESVIAQIDALNADKRELFTQLKSDGYDAPTIKSIIKARKMDADKLNETVELAKTYGDICGVQLTLF